MSNRRNFIKNATLATSAVVLGTNSLSAKSYKNILGANDRIMLGSVGIGGRGNDLLKGFTSLYKDNVMVKTLCDVDSKFFDERLQLATKNQNGMKPGTVTDMRKVYDDKEIDAVLIATPNHWHALAAIWACQAGKNAYSEKPASHNIWEGRKMVEAARKYNKIVQVGFQNRSNSSVINAINFLHNGGIGDVYMARGLCYKPRNSFGIAKDSEAPATLDYDMWLGLGAWSFAFYRRVVDAKSGGLDCGSDRPSRVGATEGQEIRSLRGGRLFAFCDCGLLA